MEAVKIFRENILSGKVDASIGLLTNIPSALKSKILDKIYSSSKDKINGEKVEIVILYKYNSKNIKNLVEGFGGEFYDLGFNFAIVNIPVDRIFDLAASTDINYMELPKNLYESDTSVTVGACGTQKISSEYGLTGKGVIAGFIDSGIDFTHPAFKDADGNTRILYIYDLINNKVYDRDTINEAIRSRNPYDTVPVEDLTGHGTHVAGEACGGGNVSESYKGIAVNAGIIMVRGGRGRWILSSNIMKGLKFLIDKSIELNMPLVVNISLSTNDGSHNGASLLEQYVAIVSDLEKVTVVVASGNEGDAGHHTQGILNGSKRQGFNVSSDESMVVINMYKPVLPDASINIIGPSGKKSGEIEIVQGYNSIVIGEARCDIYIRSKAF